MALLQILLAQTVFRGKEIGFNINHCECCKKFRFLPEFLPVVF